MKEVFVMLAKAMSKQQCIDRLSEAISEYNEAKLLGKDLKQEESSIVLSCHLLVLNGVEGDAIDVINQMDKVNKSVRFFETDKN